MSTIQRIRVLLNFTRKRTNLAIGSEIFTLENENKTQ